MKKYIFLPGGVLVVVALMWASLTLRWDRGAIALGAGGLLILALGIAANAREIRAWFSDPRGVFGVNTAFSTLLLVAALGLLNAFLAFRPVSFDWTSAGRNTLSPEAVTLARGLKSDVWMKQFGRTRDAQVGDLLDAFARAGSRITVGFVDVEASPAEAQAYAPLRNGTVVIGSGDKFRKVDRVTEPALATAIMQVTAASDVVVCFATGEGEKGLADGTGVGLSELARLLESTNYTLEQISLLRADVPASCQVLVVPGPAAGLQAVQYGRLEQYLGNGGRIALLVDPPVEAGLAAWLTKYGITPGKGVIVEANPASQSVGVGPESPLAVMYSGHPIVRGFEIVTIYDRAVPLVATESDYGRPQPLAGTGKDAFERVDLMRQSTEFQEGRDVAGPHVLGVALEMPRATKDASLPVPRLVVFGDSDFVSNALLTRQGNRDLAVRIVGWLAGEEDARTVAVPDRQNRRTTLSIQGRTLLYVVTMVVLPLIPLTIGLVQLYRSKRRGQ